MLLQLSSYLDLLQIKLRGQKTNTSCMYNVRVDPWLQFCASQIFFALQPMQNSFTSVDQFRVASIEIQQHEIHFKSLSIHIFTDNSTNIFSDNKLCCVRSTRIKYGQVDRRYRSENTMCNRLSFNPRSGAPKIQDFG